MATYTITTDTYVKESSPTTSYGAATILDLSNYLNESREGICYFYVDLSNAPMAESAYLWVYVDSYSEWSDNTTVYSRRLTSSFSNSSTWNTKPTETTTNQGTTTKSDTDTGWQSFDIKDIVNDIVGGETNYGIALRRDGAGGNQSMSIHSIENASDNDPYIEITAAETIISPSAVVITASAPDPTLEYGYTITPDVTNITLTAPTPTLVLPITVTPDSLVINLTIPNPMYIAWANRTKPSTSWTERTEPSTSWSDRTKPITNWNN